MRVIRHLAGERDRLSRVVLTLGNFDGVHLGHQAIARTALARAQRLGGQAVVLTFQPHPVAVLAPTRAPGMLQSLHDRLAALRVLGVSATIVRRFTPAFAALTPEAFVREFLLRHLDVRVVVVGYNVNFGRDRAGTGETLRALGATLGFGVEVVPPVVVTDGADTLQVSSSRVRRAVTAGAMQVAARLLGQPFGLRGRVVPGDRRGRTLGFPTANLHVRGNLVLPADGVYAVRTMVDAQGYDGVLNIGMRPTFGGRRRTIEVHLLGFAGDLYRRWLTVECVARLRGEMAFAGPDALRAQIADDVAQARVVLAGSARSG